MASGAAPNTEFCDTAFLPSGGSVVPWIHGNTRVDAPHETGAANSAAVKQPAEASAIPCGNIAPDEPVSAQLALQANQLAVYFHNRQSELDHRESEVNAQIARFETDERSTRLLLDQREADLAARETLQEDCERKLREQELDVERRLARLATAEAALQQRSPEADAARLKQLEDAAESLTSREQQLADSERRLAESQDEANALLAQLDADRRELAERRTAAEAEVAAERKQVADQLEESRRAISRRAEFLDHRWAAIQRAREKLERTHRETLEHRLATEELWARLSPTAPEAALLQSLHQIRSQLADHYSQANADLAQQRQEIDSLREQVAGQIENLTDRKRQFDAWAAGVQEDCRRQAERLAARECELREQETLLHHQSQRWQAERLRYKLEIERLHPSATSSN
jgi:hypothetical protein